MTTTIVISEFMDEAAVALLRHKFQVRYVPELVDDRAALLAAVADAEGLIVRNRTQVDTELLKHATRLRVVGRLGVGLDNIDMPACAAANVAVHPATGANARAVAEYVITATLVLLRGAFGASADVAAGKWPRNELSNGLEASERTMGIVGFGGIGRLVAQLAHGLGMRVIASDAAISADDERWQQRRVLRGELEDVLAQADVVTLHVPLTDGTRHLLDATRIASMKRGAILINTARGGVVDEEALAQALKSGALGGAALDVFEDEPLKAGSPLVGAPNLILTPHIAGLTAEANVRVSGLVAERVADALSLVAAN